MTPPSSATSTEEIKAAVRKYLADNVLYSGGIEDLGDDSSFLERNLLDSTGVLELVGFIEDHFAVKVGDDEIVPENLDSLGLIAAYITRKRASAGQASA
jgi:acyl carrier protein